MYFCQRKIFKNTLNTKHTIKLNEIFLWSLKPAETTKIAKNAKKTIKR